MRDRAERAFTVEQAERVLSGPLSEDLPENIEAIDKAVGEAHLAGKGVRGSTEQKTGLRILRVRNA